MVVYVAAKLQNVLVKLTLTSQECSVGGARKARNTYRALNVSIFFEKILYTIERYSNILT